MPSNLMFWIIIRKNYLNVKLATINSHTVYFFHLFVIFTSFIWSTLFMYFVFSSMSVLHWSATVFKSVCWLAELMMRALAVSTKFYLLLTANAGGRSKSEMFSKNSSSSMVRRCFWLSGDVAHFTLKNEKKKCNTCHIYCVCVCLFLNGSCIMFLFYSCFKLQGIFLFNLSFLLGPMAG